MRISTLLFMLLLCAPLAAQYAVTSGPLPSPYATLSNNNPTGLTHNQYTTPITPAGFQFPFFGGVFNSFQVASAGFISLSGQMSSVPATPSPGLNGGLVIAPLWADLAPGNTLVSPISPGLPVAGQISWTYVGGVLAVEWWNVPLYNGNPTNSVGVRMKLLLNTANGEIEFHYGSVPGGTTGVTSANANTVCIADLVGIVPQVVIPGQDAPFVGTNGSVTTYPSGRFIKFTPSGPPPNTAPVIAVNYNDPVGGPTALAHQGTIQVLHGHTVSALAFNVAVTDVDANDCSLAATIINIGTSGIVQAQWESATAPVPLSLMPTSGVLDELLGATLMFTLVANDGTDNTTFSFTITQEPAPPSIVVTAGASPVTSGQAATGTSRDFGTQDITAGATASITVTLENTGGSNLTISNFAVTGDAADFDVQSGGLAMTVNPASTTSFTVAFDPATVGAKLATIQFDHNDGLTPSPFAIEVIGDAVHLIPVLVVREGGPGGAIILYGGSLGFGTLDLAQSASISRVVFIQNTGNADLVLGTPTSGTAEFAAAGAALPGTLAPNASTTITVTFQPAANGAYTGAITFTHNDAIVTDPFSITVTGTATTTKTPGSGSGGGTGGDSGSCANGKSPPPWAILIAALPMFVAVTRRTRTG